MERIVSLIVLVSLLVSCTTFTKSKREYTVIGPIIISERVGEVIDAQEREYYKLFPKIYIRPAYYTFESATYYELREGGYEVRITTNNGILVAQNHGENAVSILRDYIDNYEEIASSPKEFEKKWEIVGYDDLTQPITRGEVESIRKKRRMAITCAVGGCTVPLSVGCILAMATALTYTPEIGDTAEQLEKAEKIMLYSAGIGTVCGLTGGLIGMGVEKSMALGAVKDSRKPRLME